jgi:hypothetical protein
MHQWLVTLSIMHNAVSHFRRRHALIRSPMFLSKEEPALIRHRNQVGYWEGSSGCSQVCLRSKRNVWSFCTLVGLSPTQNWTIRHAEWPGKCNKQPLCGSWLMHKLSWFKWHCASTEPLERPLLSLLKGNQFNLVELGNCCTLMETNACHHSTGS